MKKVPDYIKYHIICREDNSREDALYLSKIIKKIGKLSGSNYSSILEVACGNGRIHPFLRKMGFSVFGIDNSKELIEKVRKKYPKYSRNYFLSDMRSFDLNKRFDIVLSWFTSFGYFEDKTNARILKVMRRHLKKGGLLIIEIPNRDRKVKSMTKFLVRNYGNIVEKMFSKTVKRGGQTFWIFKEVFYSKDGKELKMIDSFTRRIRIYNLDEIKALLNDAGLEFVRAFGTGTFKNVRKNSRRMLIVVKKP